MRSLMIFGLLALGLTACVDVHNPPPQAQQQHKHGCRAGAVKRYDHGDLPGRLDLLIAANNEIEFEIEGWVARNLRIARAQPLSHDPGPAIRRLLIEDVELAERLRPILFDRALADDEAVEADALHEQQLIAQARRLRREARPCNRNACATTVPANRHGRR